jgi:hypothetical protein
VSPEGGNLVVVAAEDRLTIHRGPELIALQSAGDDAFIATTPGFERFPILFGRADPDPSAADANSAASEDERAKSSLPVIELMHGADWYAREQKPGEKRTDSRRDTAAADLESFTGHYRADSVWVGSTRVILRKGNLWLDGIVRLERLGHALFRMGEEPYSPDTAEFFYVVEGKAQLLKLNGADLWRINAP